MSIKGVLFDLEGTVVERALSDPEVLHAVLTRNRIYIPVQDVYQAVLQVKKDLGDAIAEQCGRIPRLAYHNLWNVNILNVLKIHKTQKIAKEVSDHWITTCGLRVQPDAESTLTALKANQLKTGIVSGVYEEEIHKILDTVRLDETLFDILVGADTLKKGKPDPAVFTYALQQLGITPQEALYIGDNLERDYIPAEKIGMNPLLLVKDSHPVPDTVRKINYLHSLIDYLD